jgi:hypothetical protein
MKKLLAVALVLCLLVPCAVAENEYRNFALPQYEVYQQGNILHLYGDCQKITGDAVKGSFLALILYTDANEICADCLMRDIKTKTYFSKMELADKITTIVYWTGKDHMFHTHDDCPSFSMEDALIAGTIEQAIASGNSDYCPSCYGHDFEGIKWENPYDAPVDSAVDWLIGD